MKRVERLINEVRGDDKRERKCRVRRERGDDKKAIVSIMAEVAR